jgi:2,3-bisphosphoglycerate-dependent phosphoglycerate mutase
MDPDLSSLGYQQARRLGRYLARQSNEQEPWEHRQNRHGFGLTHLYTSLMLRSVATGSLIAARLKLPLFAWSDWHEGGGIYLENYETGERVGYPGKDRLFFEQHYPALVLPENLGDGGWWNRPFEERPARWERARRVVEELIARHGATADRVGVITHGAFSNYFLKTLFGIGREQPLWFVMNNTGITRIDFEENEVRLVYQNRLDHLSNDLISS